MTWPSSFHFVGGSRHRRVGELLAVLWLLSLADLFFTLWAHRFTQFCEVNPIAQLLLESGALGLLAMFKVAMTLAGSTIFWHTRSHGRSEIALWGVVFVYVLLAFQWSHYTSGAITLAMR